MKVCSICRSCYDEACTFCTECGHSALSEKHERTLEMIAGYRLEHLLEASTPAEVYRAVHIASGSSCLITIIQNCGTDHEQFSRDAKLAAGFFHPNVVNHYESGTLGKELFVISEDAEGRSLRELLETSGTPPLLGSIQLVRHAAESLHALHLAGLMHRALRPENLILSGKLGDQMALQLRELDLGGVIGRSIVSNKFFIDTAVGALRYFSPEQCAGEPSSVRSDIYSLGVIFYELLAGVPPFDSTKASAIIEMHRNCRPPEIRIDDFDLRMLVTHTLMESLNKRPEHRQPSADAFARQLRHIEQLATYVSTPPPPVSAHPKPLKPWANVGSLPALSFSLTKDSIEAEPVVQRVNNEDVLVEKLNIDDLSGSPSLEHVENPWHQQGTFVHNYTSRLKQRRKQVRRKLAPHVGRPTTPVSVPTRAESSGILSGSSVSGPGLGAKRAKIELEEPIDDIPTMDDVLAARSDRSLDGLAELTIVADEWQGPSAPDFVVDQAEDPETTAVAPGPKSVQVDLNCPPQRDSIPEKAAVKSAGEIGFFPTLLGDAHENGDVSGIYSMLPSHIGRRLTAVINSSRFVVIGGASLVVASLILLGNLIARKDVTLGAASEPTSAQTTAPMQRSPQRAETFRGSVANNSDQKSDDPKTTERHQAKIEGTVVKDEKPASTAHHDPVGIDKQKAPVDQKAASKPVVPTTLVISPGNGKVNFGTEAGAAVRKPRSDPKRADGSTRPRIVADPQP